MIPCDLNTLALEATPSVASCVIVLAAKHCMHLIPDNKVKRQRVKLRELEIHNDSAMNGGWL